MLKFIFLILLLLSGCAKNKSDAEVFSLACMISRALPMVFINGAQIQFSDLTKLIEIPVGQDIQAGVTYQGSVVCAPTVHPDGHWALPDGSVVNNNCVTVSNSVVGNYSLQWITPRLACEGPTARDLIQQLNVSVK